MPSGQEHHKTHLAEHFRLDIRRQTVIHREPEARIARAQELHDSRDRSHVRAQENTRISRPEGCEGRRQNRHGRRRRGGNAHEAGTAQAKIAGLPANALKARGEALGIGKKLKGLRRGAQAPLHALEQREAQFISVCSRIWLSAGCEMLSMRAAAVTVPARITAMKTSSWRARMTTP